MRRSSQAWIFGVAVALGPLSGCPTTSVFVCGDDGDCGEGRCEPTGFCSFPREDCDSGWAYAELSAPQLAGECVEPEDGGTASTSMDPDTGEPPSPTVTDDSVDTSGPPPTSTSTTGPALTTEPDPTDTSDCIERAPILMWAEETEVIPPMQLDEAEGLPMSPGYAFSEVAEDGVLVAEITFPCDGPIYAWSLVLDMTPGNFEADDPDSFYLSIDDSGDLLWEYGCAFEEVKSPWQWVPIDLSNECLGEPPPLMVAAGTYLVSIRNHEPISPMGAVAGIAAFFITTDPTLHPNEFYPVDLEGPQGPTAQPGDGLAARGRPR